MSFTEGCGREKRGFKSWIINRLFHSDQSPKRSGALPRRYTLVKCVCVGSLKKRERRIVLVLSLATQKMEMLG